MPNSFLTHIAESGYRFLHERSTHIQTDQSAAQKPYTYQSSDYPAHSGPAANGTDDCIGAGLEHYHPEEGWKDHCGGVVRRLCVNEGQRFARLTVIKEVERRRNKAGVSCRWFLCECDCHNVMAVSLNSLSTGHTKSCGCLVRDTTIKTFTTHGHGGKTARTGEYRSWATMKTRCYNSNIPQFKYYGGRGIKVCERWINSFEAFLHDMGPRPAGHTIDRKDNNGDYEPSNCRWLPKAKQARNKRNNHNLTFNGKSQCIEAWADETGITRAAITQRINILKWPVEAALTLPNGEYFYRKRAVKVSQP